MAGVVCFRCVAFTHHIIYPMPAVPINYWSVLAAAVVSMVLGFLWYGPLFGKQWIALSGMSPEKLDAAKKRGMSKMYVVTFIGSLVMSYVLAHALIFASTYLEVRGVFAGVMAGFWNWLGFIAPVTVGAVLWEGKSWKLWCLNNAYHLVALVVMGIILAL